LNIPHLIWNAIKNESRNVGKLENVKALDKYCNIEYNQIKRQFAL
jgi:hypothetical protein